MINTKSKNKKLTRFLTVLILLGGFFLIKREAFAWTEPTAAPPGGNVKAPINISATQQIKIGPLTLGKDATDFGKLRLMPRTGAIPGNCSEEGQLFYQSGTGFYYCNGAIWQSMGSASGFQLNTGDPANPPIQTGWGYLQGVAGKEYTLKAVGYDDSANPLGTLYYAGVEGAVGWDNPLSYGIYGTDALFSTAYAGYFQGNVMISKSAGLGADTKLQVGTGGADEVKLCLNDDGSGSKCITSWPSGGGSFWTQVGLDTYLTRTDKNLALGGGDQNTSDFYVNVANNIDNNVKTLIGQPEDLLQPETAVTPSFFCGDGACRTAPPAENNGNCPIDCPPKFTATVASLPTACGVVWNTADEFNNATFYYVTEAYYTGHSNQFDLNSYKNGQFNHYPDPDHLNNGVTITGLTTGTTYYLQIKAWDINGNVYFSPASTCKPT